MRLRPLTSLLLAVALAFVTLPAAARRRPPAARPQPPPPRRPPQPLAPGDPMPVDAAITRGRLPNGLSYYVRANKKPEKRAELRLVVKAGSILEEDDQQGLAHFVEHMAFNGTKNFPEARAGVVPRVARHAVRRRRQRLHELRRDRLHADGPDRQAGDAGPVAPHPRGLGAQRHLRPGRGRQGARRRDGRVAPAPRRRRAHAGPDAPDPPQGIALRRPRADRQDRRAAELQARAAEAVLFGLVSPGPDGGRRRRRLRPGAGRAPDQGALRRAAEPGGARRARSTTCPITPARPTPSSPTRS